MSASVLATGRAFSSQSAREISIRAGCRQAARARARIQQNSACASSQISEFRSCMHEILLHACTTGWTTTRILRFQIDCSDAAPYPIASGAALTKR